MSGAGQQWVIEAKPTGWGYLTGAGGVAPAQMSNLHTITSVLSCAQSCLTLCDLKDCSLPASPVHGIFQARIQEGVAISFSRASSLAQGLNSCLHTSCVLQVDSLSTVIEEAFYFIFYKKLEIQTFNGNSSRCWHKLVKYSINHQ